MDKLADILRFKYHVRVRYYETEDGTLIADNDLNVHMYNIYGHTAIYYDFPLDLMPYIDISDIT